MRCRICGGECRQFETVNGITIKNGKTAGRGGHPEKQDMTLFCCPDCGHVQIDFELAEDYYDIYSEQSGSAQYSGALDLTEKKLKKLCGYADRAGRFLDIGCGVGYALGIAGRLFEHCLGVEPAQNTYSIAKAKGLNVVNAYFSRDLAVEGPISAFSAFQVFEHLADPCSALEYAFEILEPGGVGLLNVPNGQRILNEGLYHQLIFEHINYYTAYSLCAMAKRAGFEIIEIENIPETIELDLYIRKPKPHISFNERKAHQKEQLAQMLSPYRSITVWGAGRKGAQYAELLPDQNQVGHLVDTSPGKIGMYLMGIPVPVEPASGEIMQSSPAILIFASSYNAEIIQRLRKEEGYTGDIIYFEGSEVRKA